MENKKETLTAAEEQKRQQQFIEKARVYVREKSEELGRPLYACTTTFGCQMNARDSEKLDGILEAVGYIKTEKEDEADFVIYNTCTVRENANQRVYGRLGYLGSMKKKKPHMMIALCGCMMQEAHVVEKLKKSYRFVDLIFGTHNIFKFPELLCYAMESDRMIIDVWKDTDQIVEDLPVDRKYKFKSGVNIMFGCNNFCSYCIVPYVRGRERSRNPEEELAEGSGFSLGPIPWTKTGYFYKEENQPARHPYYSAGLYYLQEPSAMTPAAKFPVKPGERVLDLCAAPGGKATALGAALQGKGVLVANDISNSRAKALLKNLEVFGISNAFVTNEVPQNLADRFEGFFDKVLIDAPCSGEGMSAKIPQ